LEFDSGARIDFGTRRSVLREWVGPRRGGLALRGLELALKLGVRLVNELELTIGHGKRVGLW
jgi:flagellar biosynthesis/type III secretory pathway ATPase